MKSNQPYLIHKKPSFTNGSLIVAWCDDAGDLGCSIGEYLLEKLDMYEFADIDLSFFFSLRGVSVVNNVAQFPRSSIYCCDDKKMAILLSSAPKANWYEFLSSVLDIAQTTLDVKSIYTIGGMISLSAHNLPPDMLMSANSSSFKNDLLKYGLTRSKDYETPPGQRPTLNSYLMWLAQKRGIVAANLWVPISFYMVNAVDPRASKKAIDFFDRLLNLNINLDDLTKEIEAQDILIHEIRRDFPDIEESIRKLENNMALSEEESEQLIKTMTSLLRKKKPEFS